MTRAALLLLVVLLLPSAAVAQETTTPETEEDRPIVVPPPPTADMPIGEFRERRVALKQRTNSIRSARCRPLVGFRLATWQIDPQRRFENLAYWRAHRARALDLASRCFPARARHEYNSIPSWRISAWYVIHGCEGSWGDTGDPYWGGLQMNWGFMRTYGSDAIRYYGGPASSWPAYVQIVVADRAYRGYAGYGPRYFGPWPTCGQRV